MDNLGDLIWFLFVLLWLFSGLLVRLAKAIKSRSKPAARERRTAPRPGVRQPAPARATPPPVPPLAQPGGARPDSVPKASRPQDALSQLLKQFGIDLDPAPEQPVPAEHRRTPAEHRRTASETRRSPAEHDHTPGWHDRTASEVRRTASEVAMVPSEHRPSAGEHVRGDVSIQRPDLAAHDAPAAPLGPGFATRIRADLSGGDSLARAFVLREILGPPVGLRSPGQDRV